MKHPILRIIVSSIVLALACGGCDERVNPSQIVKKKCDRLQKLAENDQDLDEGFQVLARDSTDELCERATFDCANEPNGADCKKAIERLNMVP